MNRTRFCLAAALVLIGFHWILGADAPAPKPETKPNAKTNPELNAEYAKAYLEVVQLELKRVRDFNRRSPGTFPLSALRPLEKAVMLAEQWQQQATARNPEAGEENVHIRIAEARERLVQEDYQLALKQHERNAQAVSQFDVDRLRLKAELAHLRVAKARAVDIASPVEILHFQLGQLREDVLELQIEMTERWATKL